MTTVWILLTLSLLLRLQSRSIDFTMAFTQAPIDVPTYLDLPIGFSVVCPGVKENFIWLTAGWVELVQHAS